MNEVSQFQEGDHEDVTQTIVDSVQLFAPASPLVAVRVLYYPERTSVPEEQRYEIRRFPVFAIRQQVERRYFRPRVRNEDEPCFRTHDEFIAGRYTYRGQFVTLRFLFITDGLDSDTAWLGDIPTAPVTSDQGFIVRPGIVDQEPFYCTGRVVNAADVDAETPRLVDEARRLHQQASQKNQPPPDQSS